MFAQHLVIVKGAGDLATGVIYRLHRVGFPVIATEIAQPTVVRRTVAFAEAVYTGQATVEGITARCVTSPEEARELAAEGQVAVLVDPEARAVPLLRPTILVDAIMAKRNRGTRITDAPIVVALGPGFVAGGDAHAVIETNRGHNLGRVIFQGEAELNTGVPGNIGGYSAERLLRAPAAGRLRALHQIGDLVQARETVALVGDAPVVAPIAGVLRGLMREGSSVPQGMKLGDIDPRAQPEHCWTISDKSLAVGGGVLEAVLFLLRSLTAPRPASVREARR